MENVMNQLFGHPWGIIEFVGVIMLAGTVGGLVVGGLAIVTSYFRDSRRDEMDATLKMEMIQRGMSAQEITEVLKATSASFDPPPWASEDGRHACREARQAVRDAGRTAWQRQHQS
jgi:hypothetical protein